MVEDLIIGGGVYGTGVALELARKGHRVRLLERHIVAPVHPVNVWALNIFLTKSKTCDELNYFLAIGLVKMKMSV